MLHAQVGIPSCVLCTAPRPLSKRTPLLDNSVFIEIIETELLSLHIGNLAIYKLKEKDCENWQLYWN
jgi:hypothetical protein